MSCYDGTEAPASQDGAVITVERYKMQALLTSGAPGGVGLSAVRSGQTQRMVVRGENHQTHRSSLFSALVTAQGDGTPWLTGGRMLVTIELVGDEPRECLDVGDHFALWRGGDICQGVVTQRLFV
jgi:hypothetical protein